ncbi:MAG: YqgE/AlgH family protein [Deltaproteobacteria bacterium]|nr:YqgE/AlgH family protein [Deltaproteobacteria bacterium]
MSEIAPGFVVAVPQLGDPNFHRAVVLMLEHSDQGAMGLVVNRPAPLKLSDVARGHGLQVGRSYEESFVFVGGPVEPERGFVLHDRSEVPEAIPLFEGMFVSGSLDSLRLLFQGPPDRFRLCLGYAGWGPGQIEKELKEGAWITAEPSSRHVLATPPAQMWEAVLKDMGIDPLMLMHSGGLQ